MSRSNTVMIGFRGGCLAIDVPAGTYQLKLRYKPNVLPVSLLLGLTGLLATLGVATYPQSDVCV